MQKSSSTVPEYLALAKFAPFTGVSRPTFAAAVRRRAVRPSAYVGERPVFSLDDLPRIQRELNGN
jgi:hypothetical protein